MHLSTRHIIKMRILLPSMAKHVEKTSFSDRIRIISESKNISINEFARQVGIPQPSVQAWINQSRSPGLQAIEKIVNKFTEISPMWLITGKGEMLDMTEVYKNVIDEQDKELRTYKKMNELQERIMLLEGAKNKKAG